KGCAPRAPGADGGPRLLGEGRSVQQSHWRLGRSTNQCTARRPRMRKPMIVALGLFLLSGTAFAEIDAATERVWKANGGSCHGNDGKAATQKGKEMGIADVTTPEWQKKVSDAQIKEAIEKGVNKEEGGKKKKMDGYAGKLKPEQIDALVKFVRGLGGK